SDYFTTGFVTYANEAKSKWLHVSEETMRAHGAVSQETAEAMAVGARAASGCDVALSVTGIAGPTGGSEAKPVGLVWTALASEQGVRTRHFIMPGNREEVRERAAQMALALLYDYLS
ncbi:MAG TPA: CinA family protein, partial [Longimicrobiales bacterium]